MELLTLSGNSHPSRYCLLFQVFYYYTIYIYRYVLLFMIRHNVELQLCQVLLQVSLCHHLRTLNRKKCIPNLPPHSDARFNFCFAVVLLQNRETVETSTHEGWSLYDWKWWENSLIHCSIIFVLSKITILRGKTTFSDKPRYHGVGIV